MVKKITIKIASHFENVILHIREQIEINKDPLLPS